jgi:hypothetical protein
MLGKGVSEVTVQPFLLGERRLEARRKFARRCSFGVALCVGFGSSFGDGFCDFGSDIILPKPVSGVGAAAHENQDRNRANKDDGDIHATSVHA